MNSTTKPHFHHLLRLVLLVTALSVMPLPAQNTSGSEELTQYDLANSCFKIKSLANKKFLLGNRAGYEAQAASEDRAMTFYCKPAALGTYIFYDSDGKWLNVNFFNAIIRNTSRNKTIQWQVIPRGNNAFCLFSVAKRKYVAVSGTSLVWRQAVDSKCLFTFTKSSGGRAFPEAETNVDLFDKNGSPVFPEEAMSRPEPGTCVIGYADVHGHINHCLGSGQVTFVMDPFHPFGIQEALNDCAGWHGNGGILSLWGWLVDGHHGHPTAGYPDFPFWPTSYSTNHQQIYYKWLERSWLAGQRIFVQQIVNNKVLAEITNTLPPYKSAPVNDMEVADLQIQNTYDMQDYIDAQCGGPGKGWFRICTSAQQARNVISQGKMAVFLSLELDAVFDASEDYISLHEAGRISRSALDAKLDRIRSELDKYHSKGIRSLFPVHSFNNGFGGCQLYNGEIYSITNYLQTGDFYQPEASRNPRVFYKQPKANLPSDLQGHGNERGLSKLGAWFLDELIARKIVIDVDHMSDKCFNAALDKLWEKKYPGIIASHTRILDLFPPEHEAWEQMDIPRMIKVMQLGGIIAPMLWETLDKHQACVADYLQYMIELSETGSPSVGVLDISNYSRYGGPYQVPTSWYNTNSDASDDLICGVPYGSDVNGACMLPNFDNHPEFGAIDYDDGSFGPLYPGLYNEENVDASRVKVNRQKTGNRTFDLNTGGRGVAHYGLIPDMIKKMQTLPDHVNMDALFHSAEAYLRMLERVERYSATYPSRNPEDWPTVETEYWHGQY